MTPHNKGAMWLADEGFQIADLAQPFGYIVNIPAFVGKDNQISSEDVFHTKQIASERIHVGTATNKVKNVHVFDRPLSLSMFGSVNRDVDGVWTANFISEFNHFCLDILTFLYAQILFLTFN